MNVRITAAAAAAVLATPALAGECRTTQSVMDSTPSDSVNRSAGGHVGLHMMDARYPLPPNGDQSQLGKTAFKDWDAFSSAYDLWASGKVTQGVTVGPKSCGGSGGSQKDCVLASKLGITQAWKCTDVDAKGICTNWKPVSGTLYIGFWYANSKSTGGKWIMNTAYPSTDSQCN